MKKQLLALLIACNIYAYSEATPLNNLNNSQFDKNFKKFESFFNTPISKSFAASLENGKLTLEKDAQEKISFQCEEIYEALILATLFSQFSQNKFIIPNQQMFFHFCSEVKINLILNEEENEIKINSEITIPKPNLK